FDIKAVREAPKDFDDAMAKRGVEAQSSGLMALDERRRAIQTELQTLQAERNEKSKSIGKIKSEGGDAQGVMDEVSAMKTRMGELEEKERTLAESLNQHLASLPNILADDVPDGADEADNVEVRTWGEPRTDNVPEHFDIGEALG